MLLAFDPEVWSVLVKSRSLHQTVDVQGCVNGCRIAWVLLLYQSTDILIQFPDYLYILEGQLKLMNQR